MYRFLVSAQKEGALADSQNKARFLTFVRNDKRCCRFDRREKSLAPGSLSFPKLLSRYPETAYRRMYFRLGGIVLPGLKYVSSQTISRFLSPFGGGLFGGFGIGCYRRFSIHRGKLDRHRLTLFEVNPFSFFLSK